MADVDHEVSDSIRAAFIIGSAPTPTQNPGFFVDQLVELAVRALSPGINDPGTALMCIDRLGAALCQMAGRVPPDEYRFDPDGALRVVVAPLTFPRMADTCFAEIRRHGRSSPSITLRLLDVIAETAPCVRREEDRLALLATPTRSPRRPVPPITAARMPAPLSNGSGGPSAS